MANELIMVAEQQQAEQFQAVEQMLNTENAKDNAKAQFSNGLADAIKSAAK
ncbi:hypothetical protein [Trinickia acidisoli]|uniref:hypothetical protein n=1 Tax=Trinickia acidisoli TaxID=2767482 RepID=UPI001A907D7E|nr:hypothetical protein [Trinickia acidisoli]